MFQFARTHVSVTQAERSSGFLLTQSVLYGHEGANIAETSIQNNNPSALRISGSSQVRPVSDRYRSRLGEHNELVVEISPADRLRRPRVQEVCPNPWRHLDCIRLKLPGDAARALFPSQRLEQTFRRIVESVRPAPGDDDRNHCRFDEPERSGDGLEGEVKASLSLQREMVLAPGRGIVRFDV